MLPIIVERISPSRLDCYIMYLKHIPSSHQLGELISGPLANGQMEKLQHCHAHTRHDITLVLTGMYIRWLSQALFMSASDRGFCVTDNVPQAHSVLA